MASLQKAVFELSRSEKGILGRQCPGLGRETVRGAVTVFPCYLKRTYLAV